MARNEFDANQQLTRRADWLTKAEQMRRGAHYRSVEARNVGLVRAFFVLVLVLATWAFYY